MPYLSSHRGDYLSSYRGDPGLFSFIGKALKTGLGVVSKIGIPVVSGIAGTVLGAVSKRPSAPVLYQQPVMQGQALPGGRPILKVPGVKGMAQRAIPGGATGLMYGPKRRRMNPANPKALRRAIRRQSSFVKLARRALKGSGYQITTRGSRRTRPINIRESGPGGVSVGR